MTATVLDPASAPPPEILWPRRVPVPAHDPGADEPFTAVDGSEDPPGAIILTLPLALGRRSASAMPRPGVPEPTTQSALPQDTLPPPGAWAAQLLHAIAETDSGLRPVRHLAKCASERVLDELEAAMHRRGGPHQPAGRTVVRPVVGTVRVCRPAPGVAEVSATVRAAGRTQAVALRLEAVQGRWRCTALQR